MRSAKSACFKRALSYSASARCSFYTQTHWWVKFPAGARCWSEVGDSHFIVLWPFRKETGGGLSTLNCRLQPCPHLRKSLFYSAAPLFSWANNPHIERFCGWGRLRGLSAIASPTQKGGGRGGGRREGCVKQGIQFVLPSCCEG